MPVVTLPFPVSDLMDLPAGPHYQSWTPGDPVHHLGATEFWLTPYPGFLDFASLVRHMPHLKVVQTQTAGVDAVTDHLPPGTILCNAGGVHDAATAEMAMTLILSSLRQVPRFVRAHDRQIWDHDTSGPSLADRTVLILGYGNIGRALHARLDGFETTVVPVARTGAPGVVPAAELEHHLPHADVVVVLVPLNDATRSLVSSDFLTRMKDGALLVNMARGPVVDTDALVAELRAGRLSAALDVTDPEPLPPQHPLWTTPNTVITPHVGGGTSAMAPRMRRLITAQLHAYVRGLPLANVVTRGT